MVRATLTGGHSQRATSASTPEVRQVKTSQLQGNVEKVQDRDGFLQLRFGREPGDYIIFHVPATCRIHRDGETLPLKDVQFCDSAIVRYHRHPRFDLQLAQEIELN
jgi:hypothetical protein